MDYPEILSFMAQLVKPGSVVLGLLVVFKFLYSVFDLRRIYKIKQLELLSNCLKEPENRGTAYTIEKLLEDTYKVHIPYEQAMVIISHEQRQRLFSIYKASLNYIEFKNSQFTLLPKFYSDRTISFEKHRVQMMNFIKYHFSALACALVFALAYNIFFVTGLTTISFGVYNAVWFSLSLLLCLVFLLFAFSSLTNVNSITQAKRFVECFKSKHPQKKSLWMY